MHRIQRADVEQRVEIRIAEELHRSALDDELRLHDAEIEPIRAAIRRERTFERELVERTFTRRAVSYLHRHRAAEVDVRLRGAEPDIAAHPNLNVVDEKTSQQRRWCLGEQRSIRRQRRVDEAVRLGAIETDDLLFDQVRN